MLILAFDTTSPHGSAVLFRGPELLGEVRSDGQANYSVVLFEMVDRLLAEAGAVLADVELFAAATGPGSFTGIRVGLAAAQGWATAFERPVCGVSVLEAMVTAARPRAHLAVPLLDAHRGEFYLALFGSERTDAVDEPRFSLTGEGRVLGADRVAAFVAEAAQGGITELVVIAGEGDQVAHGLRARLPDWVGWNTVSGFRAPAIAQAALRAAREGRLQRPDELDAWYIRRSDAETNWQG